MTAIVLSIITMAMIAVLVTRPGAATAIKFTSGYLSGSIKALLGTGKDK